MTTKLRTIIIFFLVIHNYYCETTQKDSCDLKPDRCNLLCANGYLRDTLGTCICACALDPCQSKICSGGEICASFGTTAKCVPGVGSQRPECPRLTGGVCALRCADDKDCQGRLICCSNGCGKECAVPLGDFIMKASKPILPVTGPFHRFITAVSGIPNKINSILPSIPVPIRPQTEHIASRKAVMPHFEKIGQCPASTGKQDCSVSEVRCSSDADCDELRKCCVTSCGSSCTDPVKATACIHLVLAVKRLPEQELINGFVPSCEPNGKFSPVQCDLAECWCVDVNYGTEIPGSRIRKIMRRPDMCIELRLCGRKCPSSCPHGLLIDQFGCPVEGCLCRDICHGVRCLNSGDSCQLVEPDCGTPPCLPVPRCLINPCPTGDPMSLPTGVTALCVHSQQCSAGFWCHQIGYSGLGFCCSGDESSTKSDKCPARQPIKNATCVSTCKTDEECQDGKCCFDGCGLSCLSMQFKSAAVTVKTLIPKRSHFQPGQIALHNKELLTSLVADCPELPSSSNCSLGCRSDGDCIGMRRCCRAGCGTTCAYFTKSTACFQLSLTTEIYSLRPAMKCDRAGNFERHQCDDFGCFCVDITNGEELAGTRVETGSPDCSVSNKCNMIECHSVCKYGFEMDPMGCPTCRCKNPCHEVKCPQGSMCVMSPVDCYQPENCPPQARCVLSLCPSGDAAVSPVGVAEICRASVECPADHWCHDPGLSSGGLCCPTPLRPVRPGVCPKMKPILDKVDECKLECRADDDCPSSRKCCFDGCGTVCFSVDMPSVSTESSVFPLPPTPIEPEEGTVIDSEKAGNCPHFDERSCGYREKNNECGTDSQCPGVQKCCSDGCRRMCIYADKNTACLQLKAALQQIGQMDRIKCRPDGSYEQIQCDTNYCWCVDKLGVELEGTRTSEDISPNCSGPRRCQVPLCSSELDCKFGLRKDSNGCNTCECHNPCESVTCPDTATCTPMAVDCTDGPCQEVPRCVVNPCPIGHPVTDSSTHEPLSCRDSNQCIGSRAPAYCQLFKHDEGYCCSGPEPRSHPGTCPRIPVSLGDCTRQCVLDEQCTASEKCCSNGCGLTCQSAEFATPVHSVIRIGECMTVRSLGAFCSQRSLSPECSTDSDCPALFKCCSDGCTTRCTPPAITTQCIHARLSAQSLRDANPSVFIPDCDSNGEFLQIQTHYGLRWCVDESGDEIPGTKTSKQPKCRYPRSCPVRSCTKHCPFGFKTDNDGCVVCDCRSPCEMVLCDAGTVCRMVDNTCITQDCQPVAKCVPNVCPSGEPLILGETGVMAECQLGSICPAGYFCSKSGYAGKGMCCQEPAPSSRPFSCPPLSPSNSSVDDSPCVVSCRHPTDCPQSICCFNGCGTSCQFHTNQPVSAIPNNIVPVQTFSSRPVSRTNPIKPIQTQSSVDPEGGGAQIIRTTQTFTTRRPVEAVPHLLSATLKIGSCPSVILNSGCREECLTDGDCQGFLKCCKASCAARCVAPRATTSCIHLLLSHTSELVDTDIPPPVQCTNEGHFRQHQCDMAVKQCWCADQVTGRELAGTRISSEQPLPDCSRPRQCVASCDDSSTCPFGIRLDSTGCPFNGICVCQNPCTSFTCSSPLTTCALTKVNCLESHCNLLPKCMPNLCGLNPVETDDYGNPRTCASDGDCNSGRCALEHIGEDQIGMCCSVNSPTTPTEPPKQQTQTNCTNLRTAIDHLYNNGAVLQKVKPRCADGSGHFSSVQCDSAGTCWCVNPISGIEIHGTRTRNSVGENVCSGPSICSHHCSSICPYGLVLDRFGCPRRDCTCNSPCDGIDCAAGKVCILRTPSCPQGSCTPVPVCEKSPCGLGQQPVVQSLTRQQFTCHLKSPHCPSGFYCAGHETGHEGVCCPGREPALTPIKSKIQQCAHGDPFAGSSDGTPFTCSVSANGCPSTHYCSTRPGERKGICCVSKRYVCNLSMDRGPCSISVPRYSYSSVNRSCSSFEYGGCAGNLNNFATMDDCQSFCTGVGLDLTAPFLDDTDPAAESYQLGFTLTGEQINKSQREQTQRALVELLSTKFEVPTRSLSKVMVKDDNSVRFTISDVDAKEFARTISQEVASGRLTLDVDGSSLRAEPQTWFAHQIAEEPSEVATARVVFWAILLAAAIFAGIVVLIFFVTCVFLCRNSSKDSARGNNSPSNFVSTASLTIPYLGHNIGEKLFSPVRTSTTTRQ